MATLPAAALDRREVASGRVPSRLRVVVVRRLTRSRFSPTHRLAFVAAALVVGACLVVVSAQAIVAARQIRIDDLRQQLATSVSVNQNLQVERANLLAPTRILSIAEHKLGMVAPAHIAYLVPVKTTAVTSPSARSAHGQ